MIKQQILGTLFWGKPSHVLRILQAGTERAPQSCLLVYVTPSMCIYIYIYIYIPNTYINRWPFFDHKPTYLYFGLLVDQKNSKFGEFVDTLNKICLRNTRSMLNSKARFYRFGSFHFRYPLVN